MGEIVLRPYQGDVVNKVLNNTSNDLVQLATGGGKTVIFSKIIEQLKGNTLVLVHREELLFQSCYQVGRKKMRNT